MTTRNAVRPAGATRRTASEIATKEPIAMTSLRTTRRKNHLPWFTEYALQGPAPESEPWIDVTDYAVPNLMARLDEVMRLHAYLDALHRLMPTSDNLLKRHVAFEALRVVESELSLSLGEDAA